MKQEEEKNIHLKFFGIPRLMPFVRPYRRMIVWMIIWLDRPITNTVSSVTSMSDE